MRRRIVSIALGVLAVLSMGGTCRQETAENVVNAFLTELATEIAETAGEAIGEGLVEGTTP